jgi:predicted lipoprotein with Yx(FWY)xxD motif
LALDVTADTIMKRAEGWRPGSMTRASDARQAEQRSPETVKPGATDPQAAVIRIATSPRGQYITDAAGRALYLFMKDKGQQGSTCFDACAQAWPPYMTTQAPKAGDSAVQQTLLSTSKRPDGNMQVTYGGWPLYYYVKDSAAGQTTGHDVMGFGAEWYLVAPNGMALGHK